MNADGSEVQDLLNDPQILADGIMHWSPDNRYVALTGVRIEEQPRFAGQIWPTHIYVVDVESGETIHRLEDGSMHLSVSWSPDGKHLAYTSDLDGKLKIYVWDLDTANQQKVVNLEDVLLVSWSPDGLWLAGIAGPPDEKTHLYVVRPDGSNLTDLTPQMTYVASQGVDMWSPDGKCLSFSATSDQSKTSEIQWDIYVVDIINEKSIKLTDDLNFDAGGIWVSSPDKRESCNLVFQNR
jgi:Tol biopolymer transport system component